MKLIQSVIIWTLSFNSWSADLVLMTDHELISYAYQKAVRISGINAYPESKIPPIYIVSKEELGKIVCPEDPGSCDRLAAVFDDIEYRIIVRSDFTFNNAFDDSFLIHELVHTLQYNQNGPEIFKNCQAIYSTEELAYQAQDTYLKEEGAFFRASIALKFFYCDEEIAAKDYAKSKTIWEERNQK